MASPFPGMDPYLEDPRRWPDVHHGLIAEIQAELNEQLRPRYFVRVEERVYVSDEGDPGRRAIVPDLRVVRSERGALPSPQEKSAITEPVVMTTQVEEEIRDAYLEVVDAEGRRAITVIEVMSPANKVAGSRGRHSYLRKRREVMTSNTHWMEIDLLREGERLATDETLPPGDYFVHASLISLRPKGHVWPIRLREALPVVGVPLLPVDGQAPLDLQKVLAVCYERAAYDVSIDYSKAVVPALSAADAQWADGLLRARGAR